MENVADTMNQDNSMLSTMSADVSALINNTETHMTMALWEVLDEPTRRIFDVIEQKYGKIIEFSTLSWWQTNSVYRIDMWGSTYVLKVWSGLDREEKFYGDSMTSEYFPKLYDAFSVGDQKWLLLEYKPGINGKELVNDIWNWEHIGMQMWSALRALHAKRTHQVSQEDRNVAVESMIDYLSWGNTQEDLEKLRTFLDLPLLRLFICMETLVHITVSLQNWVIENIRYQQYLTRLDE
jgi:serine/threonine protein kinase